LTNNRIINTVYFGGDGSNYSSSSSNPVMLKIVFKFQNPVQNALSQSKYYYNTF
jgi:hypothetical protein